MGKVETCNITEKETEEWLIILSKTRPLIRGGGRICVKEISVQNLLPGLVLHSTWFCEQGGGEERLGKTTLSAGLLMLVFFFFPFSVLGNREKKITSSQKHCPQIPVSTSSLDIPDGGQSLSMSCPLSALKRYLVLGSHFLGDKAGGTVVRRQGSPHCRRSA